MTRVFKTLLLWLIIGALPLQAIAAVMSTSCEPGHRAALQAAERHAPQADAVAMHGEYHDAMRHAVSENGVGQVSLPDSMQNPACCNAGVGCCVAAVAPPPAALAMMLYRKTEMIANASAVLPAGYVPAIPKRPPRPFAA